MPLAAIVCCFAANCSTNDGVAKIFLTKDLVGMFFEVVKGWNFPKEDVHTSVTGLLVEDVRICGKKALWWLADDAWSSNLPNFGFQVASKNNTGPVLCGNATNGIACPWPSMPWV